MWVLTFHVFTNINQHSHCHLLPTGILERKTFRCLSPAVKYLMGAWPWFPCWQKTVLHQSHTQRRRICLAEPTQPSSSSPGPRPSVGQSRACGRPGTQWQKGYAVYHYAIIYVIRPGMTCGFLAVDGACAGRGARAAGSGSRRPGPWRHGGHPRSRGTA